MNTPRVLNRGGSYIVRKMTDAEAAWLGALIDGEGTVRLRRKNGQRENRVNVVNSELELISGCLRVTNVGSVSLRQQGKSNLVGGTENFKPLWVWQICNRPTIENLFQRIAPWCLKAQGWLENKE